MLLSCGMEEGMLKLGAVTGDSYEGVFPSSHPPALQALSQEKVVDLQVHLGWPHLGTTVVASQTFRLEAWGTSSIT